MNDVTGAAITQWLRRAADGDAEALAHLAPLVYEPLRRIASQRLAREQRSPTWSPTELVNEAFVQLLGREPLDWRDRAHFYAYAATAMRSILVDHARRRDAQKRGGGVLPLDVEQSEAQLAADQSADSLLQLDQALRQLTQINPRAARVVELRYFGGLSALDTAAELGISERSVVRDWELARALIADALAD